MAFTGIKRNYCASEGGIDHVLIFSPQTANLAITKDADNLVTSLVSTGTATAYKLEPHRGQGFYNEPGTGSYENQTFFYTQEINVKGVGMDNTVKNAIDTIHATKWLALVVFNNGITRLCGIDSGLNCEASTDESSEALGDAVAFSVTLKSPEESAKAPLVKNASKTAPYGDVASDLSIVAFA